MGAHTLLVSGRWDTKQCLVLPVSHHGKAITICCWVPAHQHPSGRANYSYLLLNAKGKKPLKSTEITKQKSPRMPLGCLGLPFWRIVIALFWHQWTYWTSFLSAVGVSRIKGVCAHVFVSARAWQEVRWMKQGKGGKMGNWRRSERWGWMRALIWGYVAHRRRITP